MSSITKTKITSHLTSKIICQCWASDFPRTLSYSLITMTPALVPIGPKSISAPDKNSQDGRASELLNEAIDSEFAKFCKQAYEELIAIDRVAQSLPIPKDSRQALAYLGALCWVFAVDLSRGFLHSRD